MIKSLQTASDAIKDGHIVCIFAEGQITRIGQLLPFRRGMERIMKDVDAPIVPVALDGVWGSIFSFEKGRFLRKLPRTIPYPVTVSFGAPMPASATAFEVRQAVQELMASAWHHRREWMNPLHRAFVRTARLHPFRFAMADAQSAKVSFGSALVRTVFLARRLKEIWRGQKWSGCFAAERAGRAANWAAMLAAVPVNLNYTVSEQTLASVHSAVRNKNRTSHRGCFWKKVKLRVACETLFLGRYATRQPLPKNSPLSHGVAAAGRFAGTRARPSKENRAGRPGHCDFFQRQHGRAEGGHAQPLQHRREH
jgi:acyl-[acyl-carrier-protein]-phospholipid O-acyltransferase/long-chain-fatty-acid--[acyl-carrier-protein] ligase